MKKTLLLSMMLGAIAGPTTLPVSANSAMGTSAPIEQFYQPFEVAKIPLKNMQSWPYYRYVSMNMEDFVSFGVVQIKAAKEPTLLSKATTPIPLNFKLTSGKTLLNSLIETQTKGFVVLKDNKVYSEFYDNGYQEDFTNNLQSASKTFAGVVIAQLADQGLIDLDEKSEFYLPELKGTVIGGATIRNIANMSSGAASLADYHTPGSNGYLWEIEIGLQSNGKPTGHLEAIKQAAPSGNKQGEKWEYTDKNTDALGLIAEKVSGKPFATLLEELFNDVGVHYSSSIAKTSDGTTSPAYGINLTAVDYALFHQYIAQGKAGQSFYEMAKDMERDVLQGSATGELLATSGYKVGYGVQTYYLPEEEILMSFGSFGQIGLSDLKTGISVINQQDWSVNADVDKAPETIARSVEIIKALRASE